MQCTEYSRRRLNLTFATLSLKFITSHKAFPVFHADRVILSGYPAGQGQPSRIWKVQCDWLTMGQECCSQLTRHLWEGTRYELCEKHLRGRLDQNRGVKSLAFLSGWHCAINLALEMLADTVIECLVQLAWGFPPRRKLMLRKVFHPAVVPQPLFRQNLLMLKLMWQLVLNRMWQIVRCMFMSGSNSRKAAVLKYVITTGKRSHVTRMVCKPSLLILIP